MQAYLLQNVPPLFEHEGLNGGGTIAEERPPRFGGFQGFSWFGVWRSDTSRKPPQLNAVRLSTQRAEGCSPV